MDIDEALVAHLKAQPGLTALVSTRIYPNEIPQSSVLPAIYYQDISDVKIYTLFGKSQLTRPMKQFTVYAASKASAKAVAKQIELALTDFSGTMSGIVIQWIRFENELSGLLLGSDGTTRTFYHDLEFEVIYLKE